LADETIEIVAKSQETSRTNQPREMCQRKTEGNETERDKGKDI